MAKTSPKKPSKKTAAQSKKKEPTATISVAEASKQVQKSLEVLNKALAKEGLPATQGAAVSDEDLLCRYQLSITDHEGVSIINNEGSFVLAGIGDKEALPEAPALLESMFRGVIWRPTRNKFMRWLNTRVDTMRQLPEQKENTDYAATPLLPPGGSLGG